MPRHPLPSLNALRAFEAAARHESFAAAAEELNVTASSVSQQVRGLETHLEVTLFGRGVRNVELTDLGAKYASAIRPHLRAIDRATQAINPDEMRTLRISVAPPLASRVILPRLAAFETGHPGLKVEVQSTIEPMDLRKGTIDLALRVGSPPWPGNEHWRLAELHAQPVCSPSIAGPGGSEDGSALGSLPLVRMTRRADAWDRYFAETGIEMSPEPQEFFVDDYPAAIEAAETLGAALAVLPLEYPLIESGRVVSVGPVVGPLDDALYAVVREQQAGDEAIGQFLDWLAQELASLDPAS